MHWPHQPTRSGQKPMQENRTFMQAFCGNDPICQDQTESWRERKKKTHCLSWANRTILTYLCVCMSTPNTLYITIKVWSMHKERRGFFFFFPEIIRSCLECRIFLALQVESRKWHWDISRDQVFSGEVNMSSRSAMNPLRRREEVVGGGVGVGLFPAFGWCRLVRVLMKCTRARSRHNAIFFLKFLPLFYVVVSARVDTVETLSVDVHTWYCNAGVLQCLVKT